MFSLRNKDGIGAYKAVMYGAWGYGIHATPNLGPSFGSGYDLRIADNANASTTSSSNLGYAFKPPEGYGRGDAKSQAFLAGSHEFTPTEVEVYYSP